MQTQELPQSRSFSAKTPTKPQITHSELFDQKAAIHQIQAAATAAFQARDNAVAKAVFCGHLMLEQKARLPHGAWLPFLAKHFPQIPHPTATRWMKAAEESLRAIDTELPLPASQLLTLPDAELTDECREARQLLLDFSEGKTIKECMAGVLVEGDPSHRLTRAVNGRKLGGHNGEDRKDWPEFIKRKLKAISEHLSHWKNFKGGQAEQTEVAFAAAIEQWPSALLETMTKQIREEMKRR